MSTNIIDAETGLSVIAIAQEDNKLRAVCLRKQGGSFEVLWTKSSEAGQTDWRSFAVECGLSAYPTEQTETGGERIVVAGFNSAGVIFYRISVPETRGGEIAAMVKLQAEARLPLPAEQMELAWRVGRTRNGRMSVTVAAAKKEQLQKFVEDVRWFRPAKIMLNCEGMVRAWRELFSGNDEPAVVVSIGLRNTQLCLAESGRLSGAVILDMGMEDFAAGKTETAERFVQDTKSVLELFGCLEPAELPVFVLSDGSGAIEGIVSSIDSAGLNVKAVLPEVQRLKAKTELSVEDVYEYCVPMGLGLMALDAGAEELNVFERLYSPAGTEEKKRWLYSLRVTGAIAAIMLVLLVFVFYAVDAAKLNAIEKHLKATKSETNRNSLMQKQKLIRTVALQRPDLLELLSEINVDGSEGMMLDRFDFKKGQPVSIAGQVKDAEQLYKFQKGLLDKKGITAVKIQNASKDKKGGKLKFTITFHYKSFTQKKGRAPIRR